MFVIGTTEKRCPFAGGAERVPIEGTVLVACFERFGTVEDRTRFVTNGRCHEIVANAAHPLKSESLAGGHLPTEFAAKLQQVGLVVPVFVQVVEHDTVLQAVVDASKQSAGEEDLIAVFVGEVFALQIALGRSESELGGEVEADPRSQVASFVEALLESEATAVGARCRTGGWIVHRVVVRLVSDEKFESVPVDMEDWQKQWEAVHVAGGGTYIAVATADARCAGITPTHVTTVGFDPTSGFESAAGLEPTAWFDSATRFDEIGAFHATSGLPQHRAGAFAAVANGAARAVIFQESDLTDVAVVWA